MVARLRPPDWAVLRAQRELGDWVEGTSELIGEDGDFYSVKGRIWTGDRTIMSGTGVFKSVGERPEPRP
jgi:hypothetical protein